MSLFGIHWAATQYIWVAPVILLIIGIYLYRQHRVRTTIKLIAGNWHELAIKNYDPYKQRIKALSFIIGMLFLLLAVLRPQWKKREDTIAQEGRDLLIALDISRSMLAVDCDPNRLECAKKKIKKLLAMLGCERVGLILFSGSAFVQCPLTSDYAAFYMFLDHVDVETISSGTTALDAALRQAVDTFRAGPKRKSKICVIFTDGEDFSSNLRGMKHEVTKENLCVYTVGVGTAEGAPIPLYDGEGNQVGHQKDAKGNVVISHLNEGILHALAQDAGGVYIPLSYDLTDMKRLVRCIESFEKDYFEDKKISSYHDRYHIFLLISFICFLAEWVL
jgi:Ca-activated chloride channel family protein